MKPLVFLILSITSSMAMAQKEPLRCRFTPAEVKKELKNLTCGPTQATLDEQMDELIRITGQEESKKKEDEQKQLPDAFVESVYEYVVKYMRGEGDANSLKQLLGAKKMALEGSKQRMAATKKVLENYDEAKAMYEKDVRPLYERYKELNKTLGYGVEVSAASTKYMDAIRKYKQELSEKLGVSDVSGSTIDSLRIGIEALQQRVKKDEEAYLEYENSIKETEKKYALAVEKEKNIKTGDREEKRETVQIAMKASLEEFKKRPGFKNCGLTDAEIYSVILFSGDYFRIVNPILRSGEAEGLKAQQGYIDVLNSALGKLQGYEGYAMRGANLGSDDLKKHCEGCVVEWKAFSSTSTAAPMGGQTHFVIKSKTGVYIAPLSSYPKEEEVLFKPGSKFKVLQVKGNEYTLEEVEGTP